MQERGKEIPKEDKNLPEMPETDSRNGENAENPSAKRRRVLSRFLFPAAAILIAAFGFYLRVANLGAVQHFQGDQGRDYLEVMNWLKDGKWPLLGPMRAVGDYTIGPGWYYTLAPLLWITDFHPSAGAITTSAIGIAAAALSLTWVLAATGSRAPRRSPNGSTTSRASLARVSTQRRA